MEDGEGVKLPLLRSDQAEHAKGDREGDGGDETDSPSDGREVGFRRERVEVGARHGLRGDRRDDGFGLGAFDPGRFEGAGGAERIEGGSVHGIAGAVRLRRYRSPQRAPG